MPSKSSHRFSTIALSSGDSLPSEFRLFAGGWNDTEKGAFLFDAQAAKSVMSAYRAWGVDLMIDLEHQSLDGGAPPEPTARDARGWCNLEVRPDGSLWAVNVRWTEDGATRLRQKRQRYVSPAFDIDDDRRVTKIVNVAITAIPATHATPALVAASASAPLVDNSLRAQAARNIAAREARKGMKMQSNHRLAAAPPPPAPTPAPDNSKLLAKVAALFGLAPGASVDEVRAAFEQAFAPMGAADAQASRELSARELRMIAEKGIRPSVYLKAKNELAARSPSRSR